MEDNEIMNFDEEATMDDIYVEETEDSGSGLGTGVAMLIGAGLAIAATATVKLGKKLWARHKEKKELRNPDDGEVIEPSEEDIVDVATK